MEGQSTWNLLVQVQQEVDSLKQYRGQERHSATGAQHRATPLSQACTDGFGGSPCDSRLQDRERELARKHAVPCNTLAMP